MDALRIHDVDVDTPLKLRATIQKSFDRLQELLVRLEKLEAFAAKPAPAPEFTADEHTLIRALLTSSTQTVGAPVPNVPVAATLPGIQTAKSGDLVIVAGALYYFDLTAGPGWTPV